MHHPARAASWMMAALVLGAAPATARADLTRQVVHLDLRPAAAHVALQSFADQTGWQVVYDPRDLEQLHLRAVRGEMSVRRAVAELLYGTRLSAEFEEFTERVYICPKPDMLPRQKEVMYRYAPLRPQDTPRRRPP